MNQQSMVSCLLKSGIARTSFDSRTEELPASTPAVRKPKTQAFRARVDIAVSEPQRMPPSPQVTCLEPWKDQLAKSPKDPTTWPL